jgi:hypothetical protein
MKFQSLDSYDLDDFYDSTQEENETTTEGAPLVKTKFKHTVDDAGGAATPLDPDCPSIENIEPTIEDDKSGSDLFRLVAPRTVKKQNREKLADAMNIFGPFSVLKQAGSKTAPAGLPANDNFKQKESWPLIDQMTRITFERDTARRAELISAARHIRELIDIAGSDSLGLSIHLPNKAACTDYALQRTESGNVHYENGQTLDRKKRTHDAKNGEANAERYDGAVRKSDKAGPVSNGGFDLYRDDPFPARKIAARMELDEIIACVGPLWLPLADAVSAGATMTDIGAALGAKHTQASGVGTAIIKLALPAAMEAINRFNERSDETYLRRLQGLIVGTVSLHQILLSRTHGVSAPGCVFSSAFRNLKCNKDYLSMPAHGSYKIPAAARAADIPVKALTRNLDRQVIKIPGADKGRTGKGHPRLFNLLTIYNIAIGHALTRVSVTPTIAMALASKFLEPQRGRKLGQPFESGKTLLLVKADGVGSIINLHIDQDISSYLDSATIVVDIGEIISTVHSRLHIENSIT